MSILSPIARGFRRLVDTIFDLFKGEAGEILKDAGRLVVPTVEAITKVDFDGDGRAAAVGEVAAAAIRFASGWGSHLLGEAVRQNRTIDEVLHGLPAADLSQWLTVARIATTLAAKYGLLQVPALNRLRALINPLYTLFLEGRA